MRAVQQKQGNREEEETRGGGWPGLSKAGDEPLENFQFNEPPDNLGRGDRKHAVPWQAYAVAVP
jgi:hypothetical protein